MKKLKSIIPGIAVCAVMAAVATLAGGINIGGGFVRPYRCACDSDTSRYDTYTYIP